MNMQAPFIRLGTLAAEWGVSPKTVKRILQREEIIPAGWGKYKTADIRRFMEENSQLQNSDHSDHVEVVRLRQEVRTLKDENAKLRQILKIIRREAEI